MSNNVESERYNVRFDPNKVATDNQQIERILKNFQKWEICTWTDGQRYLSFSRKTWTNIETYFVQEWYMKHLEETNKTIAKAMRDIQIFQQETQTQSELRAFEAQTTSFASLSAAQEYIRKLDELTLTNIVKDLLKDYKDLRKRLPRAEWNWYCRDELYNILTDNIRWLKEIRDELKRHNYKSGLQTLKARVWQLLYYFPHYEQVRQILALWWATSDIPRIIDSKQDARNARRYERRDTEHQAEMNEILSETAALSQQNRVWERQEEALESITNWEQPPVQVTQNTNRYTYSTFGCPGQSNPWCRTVCRPKSFNRRFGERFANMLEQIFPNGMNRDPRQKEAWTNIWSVIAVWWAIFMWIKALSCLKKWADWKRNRWWFAWWTAGTLALLYNDKIINTIQDAINRHPAERTRAVTDIFANYWFNDIDANNIAQMYIWAPIATLSALHFIPIYDLEQNKILQDVNGQIKFNYDNYEKYLTSLWYTEEQKQQLLTQWRRIKDNDLVGLWLWAFGIWTMDDLHSLYNWDRTKTLAQTSQVQEGWDNCVEWIQSEVNAELFKQWLRAKNPTARREIVNEYNAKKDTTNLKDLILEWMRGGKLEMSASDKKYKLEDMISKDPEILNLEKKTMVWFTNSWWTEIEFDSYEDLFNTVHLTEWIKQNFKRPAVSENPFHIDSWRIEFDDTEWYQVRRNETAVVRNRTLKKTSSILGKNKQYYVDYLNARRRDAQKIEIDAVKYPMASKLWINFYNDPKEIENIDNWLKKIKLDRGTHAPTPNKAPFEITIRWNLQFTAVDWSETIIENNLSQFPTIRKNSENRKKLLDYLNDKNNGMCNR